MSELTRRVSCRVAFDRQVSPFSLCTERRLAPKLLLMISELDFRSSLDFFLLKAPYPIRTEYRSPIQQLLSLQWDVR
jgi:hypothetical protein